MTHGEMIAKIADQTSMSRKEVDAVLKRFVDNLRDELSADEEVGMPGLGKFRPKFREAGKGRNPRTGEEMEFPAVWGVKFSAAKALKEALNTPLAEERRKRRVAA